MNNKLLINDVWCNFTFVEFKDLFQIIAINAILLIVAKYLSKYLILQLFQLLSFCLYLLHGIFQLIEILLLLFSFKSIFMALNKIYYLNRFTILWVFLVKNFFHLRSKQCNCRHNNFHYLSWWNDSKLFYLFNFLFSLKKLSESFSDFKYNIDIVSCCIIIKEFFMFIKTKGHFSSLFQRHFLLHFQLLHFEKLKVFLIKFHSLYLIL